jgi:uncharacterized phage protein (TIGR01671 family)
MPKEKRKNKLGEKMREIRFRAWDKINKKMYNTKLFETWWYTFADKDETGHERASIPKDSEQEQRSRLEVMQFTGLKDKNNKEIYEGDIVRFFVTEKDEKKNKFSIGFIIWNNNGSNFVITFYNQEGEIEHYYFPKDCEITGNIYETEELLDEVDNNAK